MASSHIERVSPLATRSKQGVVVAVTREMVQGKADDARRNVRGREIHVLHTGDEDPVQRMLNALQPGSYVTPHRHLVPPKVESLVLLQGSLAFVSFDDAGEPDEDGCLVLSREADVLAVDCRPGVWHTFFALEPDTVVFEVKAGPYVRGRDQEWPEWAPSQNGEGGREYLADLEDRFRQRFGLPPRAWRPS